MSKLSDKALSRAARVNPVTPGQISYLEILFNDCGFNTRQKRNDYLTQRCARVIRFLDQLSLEEASGFITDLKDRKEELREETNDDSSDSW